jgi:hypothetical protein
VDTGKTNTEKINIYYFSVDSIGISLYRMRVHTMKYFFNALTPITSPNRTAYAGKVLPTAVAARQPTTLCSHSGLLRAKIRLSGASYCSFSA